MNVFKLTRVTKVACADPGGWKVCYVTLIFTSVTGSRWMFRLVSRTHTDDSGAAVNKMEETRETGGCSSSYPRGSISPDQRRPHTRLFMRFQNHRQNSKVVVRSLAWCSSSCALSWCLLFGVRCLYNWILAIATILTMFNILLSLVRNRRTLNTKQEVAKMGTMLKSQRFIRTIPKEKQLIEPVF